MLTAHLSLIFFYRMSDLYIYRHGRRPIDLSEAKDIRKHLTHISKGLVEEGCIQPPVDYEFHFEQNRG